MKLKLTNEQIETFATKIFNLNFPNKNFGEFKDQDHFTRSQWIHEACDMIDGYNCTVQHIDFPGISVVKNCCRLCKFVDLYRPACNLRGDDISLECVCGKFELFEFEDEEDE
jgi:hypothetical protein